MASCSDPPDEMVLGPSPKMAAAAQEPIVLALLSETCPADLELTSAELAEAIDRAWRDIRAGRASGGKTVLSLPASEFWSASGLDGPPVDFAGERLGWKLSCLYSVNPHHAGVKVIGANAFNRHHGLARSTSTFVLMEKLTMRLVAIVDATALSAARTGFYACEVLRLCLRDRARIDLFLFGAGPIAKAVLVALAHGAPGRIGRVFLRARSLQTAAAMQEALAPSCPFEMLAVDDNQYLPKADFVVTATNSDGPVFADEELARHAVTLHLGGDEVPLATLRRVLRQGHIGCDDLATVSRRNSQSLALMFSRSGSSLEALGPHLGIFELSKPADWSIEPGAPVSITCVGLPMLDLYAVEALYHKHLRQAPRNPSLPAPATLRSSSPD